MTTAVAAKQTRLQRELAICEEIYIGACWGKGGPDEIIGSSDCELSREAVELFNDQMYVQKIRCPHCGTLNVVGDTNMCEAMWIAGEDE